MKIRNPIRRRRKTNRQFQEPQIVLPCPKWLQRRMFRNLKEAAVSRVNPVGARRAGEILKQIQAEPSKAQGGGNSSRPQNVGPRPMWTPLEQSVARPQVGQKRSFPSSVKRGIGKVVAWLSRVRRHSFTRGLHVAR
jgi:hypothetical protein